jgi:methylthioribose-1-phosphate isomerase
VRLLDQRCLPATETYVEIDTAAAIAAAIESMIVRGAPAIGIAAAYGAALAARSAHALDPGGWRAAYDAELERLRATRPTAVNLGWALDRMARAAAPLGADPFPALIAEAERIRVEDLAANHAMGASGASLIAPGASLLTHCNAGALATAGYGTALGVVRAAWGAGRLVRVYATETRPWLQGARLTAWELLRDGIPVTLITDGAAAHLMRTRRIDWVIVGADRIAANGDTANKIGTYALALAARAQRARMMVVAPRSSIDRTISTGAGIPVEERAAAEVLEFGSRRVAAAGADAWNPVFDVTPAALIDALVTEAGIVSPPTPQGIAALF